MVVALSLGGDSVWRGGLAWGGGNDLHRQWCCTVWWPPHPWDNLGQKRERSCQVQYVCMSHNCMSLPEYSLIHRLNLCIIFMINILNILFPWLKIDRRSLVLTRVSDDFLGKLLQAVSWRMFFIRWAIQDKMSWKCWNPFDVTKRVPWWHVVLSSLLINCNQARRRCNIFQFKSLVKYCYAFLRTFTVIYCWLTCIYIISKGKLERTSACNVISNRYIFSMGTLSM